MMRIRLLAIFAPALAVGGILAACGDEPESAIPTAPGVPRATALTISGPDNVAPGESVQFRAQIRRADGSSKFGSDDTHVRWSTTDAQRLAVDTTGVVTARSQVGQAVVSAEITLTGGARIRGSKEVTVMPAGTYRLTGLVREVDPPNTQVIGARVEVTPAGPATTTLASGVYQLYGVPAQATVRVSAAGYDSLEQNVNLTANASQNFSINRIGPPLNLSGPFTLTIDAVGSCVWLPPDLLHRTYDASVTQTGSTIDVRLTEPRFKVDSAGKGNRFTGKAFGPSAIFTLQSFSFYTYYGVTYITYPDVAEQLPNGNILVVDGFTIAPPSGSGLSGEISGAFSLYDSRFPLTTSFIGSCPSSVNRFTLSPR